MALKISESAIKGDIQTRVVSVDATEPLDQGKIQRHKFSVELEVVPKEEWETWMESRPKDTEVLNRTLRNAFEIINDDTKEDMPFDDTLKQLLIDTPWLFTAIFEQQMALQLGKTSVEYKKLKAKNS